MKVLVVTIALLVMGPGVVIAAVPSPLNSTVPAFIDLVGSNAGVPDPAGQIVITVRDNLNTPIASSTVMLDFGNCSDARLSLSQPAGVVLDCTNKRLMAVTNLAGQATFIAMGAASIASPPTPPALAPGAAAGCVRVYADGVQLATSTLVIADLNGSVTGDGVNGIDYEVLAQEVAAAGLGAPYRGRDDFSHDGAVNAIDLAFLRILYIAAGGSVDPQLPPYGTGFCP